MHAGPQDHKFTLDPRTVSLLRTVESTSDESEREQAIKDIAVSGDESAGRILIEAYDRSMWRSTKISIVRALGSINSDRVVEFLINTASNRQDLVQAREAIMALSMTGNVMAGEFLLTVLKEKEHPLCKYAVIGLTDMYYFPCEQELADLLDRPAGEVSPALLQYIIIALGRKGCGHLWGRIRKFLDIKIDRENEMVFNAALIAAGFLGSRGDMEKLDALDTRYHFFSNYLKKAAVERIELRSRHTIEDAISALLSARSALEKQGALQLLKEFPRKESWDVFTLFSKDIGPELSCLVRVVLFDGKRSAEDREFISRNWKSVNIDVLASLVAAHSHGKTGGYPDEVYADLPLHFSAALMGRVKEPGAMKRLFSLVSDGKAALAVRVTAINSIVAQVLMGGRESSLVSLAGDFLFGILKHENDAHIRLRAARALGQIGFTGDALLMEYASMLKEKENTNFPSVYAALSMMRGDEAANIILRRIKTIALQPERRSELLRALHALSFMGHLPDAETLTHVPPELYEDARVSLLKILTANPVPGMSALVADSLGKEDFQTGMLALAAAKFNNNPEIYERLFKHLAGANACLASRALDSLCAGGDAAHHEKLLSWLMDTSGNKETALKVLRSITPDPKSDQAPVIKALERLLLLKDDVFSDKEVRDAARNLKDNISMLVHEKTREKLAGAEAERALKREAELDKKIAAQLVGLPNYSEMVRSVLRNAELTFQHPELFNNRVDKSTIIVEYVKSIDLLMQERLGAKIFLSADPELFYGMQTRVVQMQLEDESVTPARLIKDLKCESHFDLDTFPFYKLNLLGRDILSGKILYSQYKSIDGLRAWAVILLLFARKFRFREISIEPVFPVKTSANDAICALAAQMNELQEIRNQAAHRGTMLDVSSLTEARLRSLDVLNKLEDVLT